MHSLIHSRLNPFLSTDFVQIHHLSVHCRSILPFYIKIGHDIRCTDGMKSQSILNNVDSINQSLQLISIRKSYQFRVFVDVLSHDDSCKWNKVMFGIEITNLKRNLIHTTNGASPPHPLTLKLHQTASTYQHTFPIRHFFKTKYNNFSFLRETSRVIVGRWEWEEKVKNRMVVKVTSRNGCYGNGS